MKIKMRIKNPKVYDKPYPTIGDLIKDKDYDYVFYYLRWKGTDEFAGVFRTEKGKIISLDGDVYGNHEEVVESGEWGKPEEGIYHGLTVVCPCE